MPYSSSPHRPDTGPTTVAASGPGPPAAGADIRAGCPGNTQSAHRLSSDRYPDLFNYRVLGYSARGRTRPATTSSASSDSAASAWFSRPSSSRKCRPDSVAGTTITVGNWKPRLVAMCERHEKELLTPLMEILREVAVAPESAPARPGKFTPVEGGIECQICGANLKNRGSMGSHVRQMHDMLLTDYRAQYENGQPAKDDTDGPAYVPSAVTLNGPSSMPSRRA